jgi:radical SAM superfamily enzyme YgiQ (UPF0313 family)
MRILYLQKDPFVNAGVTQLAAYTDLHGHTSHLLIENAERDLRRSIRRFDPDIVAFSVATGIHLWGMGVAKRVKAWFPEVKILFGGMHPTFYPEMVRGECIDIICRGDGEDALLELLDTMENGEDYTKILNLWVKEADGTIHRNTLRALEQDLDRFPFPNRGLYDHYAFVREQKMEGFITPAGAVPTTAPSASTWASRRS